MVFANGAPLCSAVTSVALAAAAPAAVASSPSLWSCRWREAGPTRMGANIGWPKSSSDRSSALVLTIIRARNVIRSRAERSPPAMAGRRARSASAGPSPRIPARWRTRRWASCAPELRQPALVLGLRGGKGTTPRGPQGRRVLGGGWGRHRSWEVRAHQGAIDHAQAGGAAAGHGLPEVFLHDLQDLGHARRSE